MSRPYASGLRDRIEADLVEADFEIGFNLADLAEAESDLGDRVLASRILQDAEGIFRDIEQRLDRIGQRERACFCALTGELRRTLDLAALRNARAVPPGD